MVRVKKGVAAKKHRKHLLKYTKGFRWGRQSKYRLAKDAIKHAWKWSYRDRKDKKAIFRQIWSLQISVLCKKQGISYSKFINGLKKNNIELDRKVLALIAQQKPEIFEKIVEAAKK